VDGSHTTDFTFSDLNVANCLLGEGGVLALDDWENGDWPGVILGKLLLDLSLLPAPSIIQFSTVDYHF
jgi:hypothetical protein